MHITLSGTDKVTTPSGSYGSNFQGSGDWNTQTNSGDFNLTLQSGTFKSAGLTMKIIIVGSTLYFPSNTFASIPGVKPWFSESVSEGTSISAQGSNVPNGISSPNSLIDALLNFASIDNVGQDNLNGVETTEYKVTINVAKLVTQQSNNEFLTNLKCLNISSLPITIWVDHEGIIRQLSYTINAQLSNGSAVEISSTISYSNFGEPVSIQAPPASEVEPYSSFISPYPGLSTQSTTAPTSSCG